MELISINKSLAGKCVYLEGYMYLFNESAPDNWYIFSDDSRFDGSSAGEKYGFSYSWACMSRQPNENEVMFKMEHNDTMLTLVGSAFNELGVFYDLVEWRTTGDLLPINMSEPEINALKKRIEAQRKERIKTIPNVLGDEMYEGVHGYHTHGLVENHMRKGGSEKYKYWVGIELEVECNNQKCYDWLSSVKSNWFYLERDSSLGDGRYGVEIITIRMHPKVASNPSIWEPIVSKLSELGATSHDNGRCGLHVHISREAFGATEQQIDATVGKIMHMYNNELGAGGYGENYIYAVMRRGYSSYCQDVVNALPSKKRSGFSFMKDFGISGVSDNGIKEVFNKLGSSETQNSRYDAINRKSPTTVEFRQGRGTLRADSISTTVQFCCELVDFARAADNKKCNRDNFFNRLKKLPKHNPLRNILFNNKEI